jgi:hypothetical protein
MASSKSARVITTSPDGLITLETLQAAAKGLQSQRRVGWNRVCICSCNAPDASYEMGEDEESKFEYLAHA